MHGVLEAASVSARIGQASRSAVQEETKGEARKKGSVVVGFFWTTERWDGWSGGKEKTSHRTKAGGALDEGLGAL